MPATNYPTAGTGRRTGSVAAALSFDHTVVPAASEIKPPGGFVVAAAGSNLTKSSAGRTAAGKDRIARDMHDDMGSGLTTILYLCQDLDRSLAPSSDTVPAKIAATARSLTTKMNEIIWSMNQQYDTMEDLVAYIRHHAGELLDSSPLNYVTFVPESIPAIRLSGKARRNIYLVVKEALHNALKHARATHIQIDIQVNSHLIIRVKDNGQGMVAGTERRFSNGLQNMQARMDFIGAALDIQTAEGTLVMITVPLAANDMLT
ncbi:sensor histidine kinase [Niastella koreensis]|nr:ATP-binding protein [Niastella koreensis]